MRRLNQTKKTRLKAMFYTNIFLGLVTLLCLLVMYNEPQMDLTVVMTTCIAGILTITTMFIGGDSYRKSDPQPEPENY